MNNMSDNYNYTYQESPWNNYWTPSECRVLSAIYGVGGCIGSIVNLFILSVLIHKLCQEGKRTALDLLFAVLTFTDFLGCSVLIMAKNFLLGFGQCYYSHLSLTVDITKTVIILFLLRTMSILVLDSIAVNRFLIIWCKPTKTVMTFRLSCFVILFVLLLSLLVVSLYLFAGQFESTFFNFTDFVTADACFTFVNVLLIVVVYSAICYQLWQKLKLSKQKKKLAKEQSSNSYNLTTTSTVAKTRTDLMEQMMRRSVVVAIVVTSIYVFCFLPEGIFYIIVVWKIEVLVKYDWLSTAFKINSDFFYNLNFLIMPFAYAILCHDFRRESIKLMTQARKKIMFLTNQRSKNNQPTGAGINAQIPLIPMNTSTVNQTEVHVC